MTKYCSHCGDQLMRTRCGNIILWLHNNYNHSCKGK